MEGKVSKYLGGKLQNSETFHNNIKSRERRAQKIKDIMKAEEVT